MSPEIISRLKKGQTKERRSLLGHHRRLLSLSLQPLVKALPGPVKLSPAHTPADCIKSGHGPEQRRTIYR